MHRERKIKKIITVREKIECKGEMRPQTDRSICLLLYIPFPGALRLSLMIYREGRGKGDHKQTGVFATYFLFLFPTHHVFLYDEQRGKGAAQTGTKNGQAVSNNQCGFK